ncbi:MAG TPA: hypothetical protein VF528_20085 [Pyrinomonadaceae bacterium]|jgi:hypothetical protein
MKREIFLALSVVSLALFASGCFNKSGVPLSSPEAAQPDKSLAGAWYGVVEGRDVYLHVIPYPDMEPEKKAWMRLVHVIHPKNGAAASGRGEEAIILNMFPTVAGGRKFMNILFRKPEQTEGAACEIEEYYWFWKYEVSRDGVLTVWELDDETIRLALENEKLKGRYRKVSIYLEDSSEHILAYLLSDEGQKAFRLYGQFKKIR